MFNNPLLKHLLEIKKIESETKMLLFLILINLSNEPKKKSQTPIETRLKLLFSLKATGKTDKAESLNLIKKTENPLQDSASIHRSLSSCHAAKKLKFGQQQQQQNNNNNNTTNTGTRDDDSQWDIML